MRRAPRRTACLAVGLLPAMVLASCSDSAPSTPPPSLTAGVQQDRVDATNRQISIPLVNHGRSAVTIEGVQLVAPQFTAVPGSRANDEMTPGLRLNFPINFGTARCGASPAGRPAVRVRLHGKDQHSRTITVAVTDERGLIERLRKGDCQQQSLLRAVSVDYGPVVRRPGRPGHPVLHGSLILRRKAATGPVTVVETRGSVLYDLVPGTVDPAIPAPSPVAVLGPAADTLTVPVLMSIPRCDPHVLIEAKKVYFFSVGLRIGNGPEQFLQIPPPVGLQQSLRELFGPCPDISGRR